MSDKKIARQGSVKNRVPFGFYSLQALKITSMKHSNSDNNGYMKSLRRGKAVGRKQGLITRGPCNC